MAKGDATLTDALAGIVSALRAGPGRAGNRGVLRTSSDRFLAAFRERLQFGEEAVLPALRRAESGTASRLDVLEQDHDLLRGYAGELSRQIQNDGGSVAYGLSRTFLAALLGHFGREREEARRISEGLSLRGARRLREALRNWRPGPSGSAPERPGDA